jgi:hypothetical protein
MALAIGSDVITRWMAAAAIGAALLAPGAARADVSAADKAAAEALFNHAKSLMKEGRYPEACSKFQESQRIDPGIGTMLYMADCFEKNGQTASAWAEFLEAAAAAKAAGQAEREQKARDRAAALEPKLSRLSITVSPGGELEGLVVKRDGTVIHKALWGTPVPLDPGEHTIEATAPGRKPWSKKVTLVAAAKFAKSIIIPRLEDAPKPSGPVVVEPPRPPVPGPPTSTPEPPKPGPRSVGPIVTTRDTFSPPRIVGGVFLGVGLATAGVGAILGMVALLKKSSASPNCHDNGICNQAGADSMNSARSVATGSNATLIAGGLAFTTGLVILIATRPVEATNNQVLQIGPLVGEGARGLAVGGRF